MPCNILSANGEKGFAPINIIELAKPENVPAKGAHSTLSNKLD